MKMSIPNDVKCLMSILENNGFSVYVVCGCVRDTILGRPVHDWDICTSAKPDEIKNTFKNFKVIETGLKHGTLTILLNSVPYEITTYRVDGKYSDGRRPDDVRFTDNIIEDLQRRDFTMNAIAYNPNIGIIDPFNGIKDISSPQKTPNTALSPQIREETR